MKSKWEKTNSVGVVPEWNPAAERLEGEKKAWEAWGGFRRYAPWFLWSIRRTSLFAVTLPLLHWILSVTPGTERPRGSGFTQQDRQQRRKNKRCLASLPVGDVISWLCLPGSAPCPCVFYVYGEPIKWKSRRARKGPARPSLFFQSFSSCRQSSQPTYPTKARPAGKGPEKTTPLLKPHIEQREQSDPTKNLYVWQSMPLEKPMI